MFSDFDLPTSSLVLKITAAEGHNKSVSATAFLSPS